MIWVLLLFALSLADGALTITMVEPENELNPLISSIWAQYGYMWMLAIKQGIVTSCAMLLYHYEEITALKLMCLVFAGVNLYHLINFGVTF